MTTLKAVVRIQAVAVERLPITLENLALVTSIVYKKRFDNFALLVEFDPKEADGKEFCVLDLTGSILDLKEVGPGGIKAIRAMLEAITGQSFVPVTDDNDILHYRRSDFHEKVLAHERSSP